MNEKQTYHSFTLAEAPGHYISLIHFLNKEINEGMLNLWALMLPAEKKQSFQAIG